MAKSGPDPYPYPSRIFKALILGSKDKTKELLLSVLNTEAVPELDLSNIRTLTLNSAKEIPIGNTKAWLNLQLNDPAISGAINYRKTGQQPPKTGTYNNEVKFYV